MKRSLFSNEAPRIAEAASSTKYGNGRRGVWDPNLDRAMILRWKRQVWRAERQVRTMVNYPSKNGFNDPLSITCVLDLLLRLETYKYLSAFILSELLTAEYPQVVWDQWTVGRIMKALVEEAAITQRPNNEQPPISEVRFTDGRVYLVNPSPGNHYWLCQLREYFGRHAERTAADLREGREPVKGDELWGNVTTLPWGVPPGL